MASCRRGAAAHGSHQGRLHRSRRSRPHHRSPPAPTSNTITGYWRRPIASPTGRADLCRRIPDPEHILREDPGLDDARNDDGGLDTGTSPGDGAQDGVAAASARAGTPATQLAVACARYASSARVFAVRSSSAMQSACWASLTVRSISRGGTILRPSIASACEGACPLP